MKLFRLLCLVFSLLAISGPVVASPEASEPAPALRRGINILGYDPIWRDAGQGRFKEKHFRAIREAGFDFVRVNLQAFRYMNASGELDRKWLDRLDWVVRGASQAGLAVILDEHDFDTCSKDPAICRIMLGNFWKQVAPRYRASPASVMFELLNEPHDKLDADGWNQLLVEMLAIVRRTNPTRTVVIGPTRWNSADELPSLRLPDSDRNILVTFHYYEPFRFTHQGASWTAMVAVHGIPWGSDEDRARLAADFARVAAWSRANRRPVLLGEFGAYDKGGTPIALRAAYDSSVAREAEKQGLPWAYWQFDSDFVAYDIAKDEWVQPIRDALVPRP
ncbi:MAG: glycoside hydrolase family 5 protein [Alphaproteobacteria bacterium]|nr:glycoside hydrolase family 5 protein [Alphaproteobacteria bacterium]